MNEELIFSISPDFKSVDMVRSEMQHLLDATYAGPEAESRAMELCLAATEAMNNAVEHSSAKQIHISVVAGETQVAFRIVTEGVRFDPTTNVEMPVLGDGDQLQEGGFGRAIIKEMVDAVRYEYAEGKNILTLEKTMPGVKKGD